MGWSKVQSAKSDMLRSTSEKCRLFYTFRYINIHVKIEVLSFKYCTCYRKVDFDLKLIAPNFGSYF